jgi:oxalate decarboxylase
MLCGSAHITAIDPQGRNFVDDVGVGDFWYFRAGHPALHPGARAGRLRVSFGVR